MARHPIPQVIDDLLTPLDASGAGLPAIPVGSTDWYRWLNDPATRSFAFSSPQGTFTARNERRHGAWYWYAYRSRNGHLHKLYLGKSEELTPARLDDAASTLATAPIYSPREPEKAPPFASPASSQRLTDLLATKLYVPPPRLDLVARPRLMGRLNTGITRKLTFVVAPAGWGKTTLLSAWHADTRSAGMPLAWVSLDAEDNNPVRFWTYVITALGGLQQGLGEMALALLRSPPPHSSRC